MDGEDVAIAVPQSLSATPSEIAGHTIIDEGIRVCPLCHSEVRLFFINFNEKMLMCENTDCEFPFGHEELQFVKEDNEVHPNEEVVSIRSKASRGSPTGTCSIVSAAAWSEINKLNQMCDAEDNHLETLTQTEEQRERDLERQNKDLIQKHIEDLRELNMEWVAETSEVGGNTNIIKNEKWIKTLKSMQEMSGVQLLKPEEIKLLKKEEPVLGLGELKIDIDPGNNTSLSTIKIEIHNLPNNNNTEATTEIL